MDGKAQTSCSLLSDPGDLTAANLAQDGVQARGRGSTWTILCPVFTARNTEKMWAQEPTPASPLGAATRSRPPGALHAASAPGTSAKPHATNRATRSDPVGDGSPASNPSTSKQQPLLLLPPSLPSVYPFADTYGAAPLSQALHERTSPSEHPSDRNGALMHSWLSNAGRLSTALGAALPLGLTLLFFPTFLPLDFLVIYSPKSSPSLLPPPCTFAFNLLYLSPHL